MGRERQTDRFRNKDRQTEKEADKDGERWREQAKKAPAYENVV